jgi:hypothetical protein
MKITLDVDGGFAYLPGTGRPVVIDTSNLDGATAGRLESLVAGSRFFDQPTSTPPAPGAADFRTYSISVEDRSRTHSIEVSDPIEDEGLAKLVFEIMSWNAPPES